MDVPGTGRPGTQEASSKCSFSHLPLPLTHGRKPETVNTVHPSMGERQGGQKFSPPRNQVLALFLREFPWFPILSPALKNAIDGPLISATASSRAA